MSRETKTIQFKVRATGVTTDENGDRLGHLEIYGAAFGNIDEGNDRINKGAFARTIQNSKARAKARDKKYALKMLWQHDTNEIIGGWEDLSEDTEGLRAKGDVALKTQRGAEFYELAELEMIDEFSIIYEVMPGGAKYDKSGVRDLTELRLFSIDPVTFPMNDDPHIIKIKSKDTPVDKKKIAKQLKTLLEHYNEEQAEDLLEDWQDVFVCSLTCAVLDAFTIGDSPQADISQALDDFKELVLTKFVAQALECNLSGYLEENTSTYSYNSAESTLHNGSADGYGYMARATRHMQQKRGAAISAANQDNIASHVANVHDTANKAMKEMKANMKALHDAADSFAEKMQGDQADSGKDDDKPDDADEKSFQQALANLKSLH